MATEAATGQPANVQAYLGKHKIQTLFEDLTALLVKDLPDNPIDFLIQKLQAKKKKVTSGTTRPTASASSKSLDVTGTAAAKSERTKPPTKPASGKAASANTKAPSRPTTAPASKSTTTKPAGTTGSVASSKSATSISKSSASSAGSKTSGAPKTSTGLKKPSTGAAATGKQPPPASKTTGGGTGGTPKRPVSSGKASGIPTSRGTPTGKTAPASSKLQKPGAGTPPTTRKPVTKPVAKVTEAPPAEPVPKKDPLPEKDKGHDEEEEEEKEEVPAMATEYESDEEEDEGGHFESKTDIDIDDLISKIKKSKQPRNCKSHLIVPVNTQQQGVSSEGYMSDSEGEESEEGLEVVEDAADLEEEGVYLTGEARKISLKLPSVGPSVDLKVLICARCAKIISKDEDYSTISSSKLTSIEEFESASQVAATSSNSQWETEESSAVPVTLKQKWAATCMPKMRSTADDTSSAVTSSSHDTWQGIEPVNRPDVTSEEESELKVPAAVDYHKMIEETTEEEGSANLIDIED